MNPSKVQMVAEKPSHYEMHDGKSPFKVPKAGLSEDMHAKIKAMAPKKMADGGEAAPNVVEGVTLPPLAERRDPGPSLESVYQNVNPAPLPATMSIGAPAQIVDPNLGKTFSPAQVMAMQNNSGAALDREITQAEQDKARTPAGLMSKEDYEAKKAAFVPPTTPTPSTAPPAQAPAAPSWNPGADRSVSEMAQATKDEQAAITAKGSAEAEMARNQAAAFAEQQKVLQASALEQKAQNQRAHDSAQAAMAKVQAAREEMAKVDTTVDPGRYWASKSMPGKLAAIVGLALGAIGAGNDGVNRAAGMIQQNIDRDIEAQKAEHEFRLKKGQAGVDAAQNLYAMNHAALQDDIAATAATKASGLELAENQLKQIAATAQSPIAKANAAQLAAQLQTKRAEFDGKAFERKTDAEKAKELVGIERQKIGIEQQKVDIDRGRAGAKGPADKDLTEVQNRAANMRASIAKAKAIIAKTGTFEMTGPENAELKKALTDYAIDSAKLKDPSSAAREGEVATELKALGVESGSLLTSNATAQKLLDNALKDIDSREQIARKSRGL